jgi:hypothetical protein
MFRGVQVMFIGGMLMSCATAADTGDTAMEKAKQNVIVTLNVSPKENGNFNTKEMIAVRKSLISKLEGLMTGTDFSSIRTYETLPLIALTADERLTFFLLAQPEVLSLEQDRELDLMKKN